MSRNTDGLKKGNTVGTGRKKSIVRRMCLDGTEASAKYFQKVAKGDRCIPVPSADGKTVGYRYPGHQEMLDAANWLAKYGLGTNDTRNINLAEIPKETLIELLMQDETDAGAEEEA